MPETQAPGGFFGGFPFFGGGFFFGRILLIFLLILFLFDFRW